VKIAIRGYMNVVMSRHDVTSAIAVAPLDGGDAVAAVAAGAPSASRAVRRIALSPSNSASRAIALVYFPSRGVGGRSGYVIRGWPKDVS